ncbi:MAG: Verru_Chthon cassette protein A [Terrimicrobiaceae bacterium]
MRKNIRRPPRGTALVIVLAMLVLMVAMVLAFFSSVTSESGASTAYAAGVTVQKLGDTAVNLAAAQIQYATKGMDGAGNDITWASQPGAIRTYAATGAEGNVFKLYSAQNMVAPAATFKADLSGESAASSSASPALFTDLNEPVLTGDSGGGIAISGTTYRANYPIFDPSALGAVDGLSIGGSVTPPSAGYNPVASGNPAPMPVRWLYVLQNGEVVNPTGTGNVATVAGADPASNPIVGRVAFWTDDDTSKVNINTAGEGSFWDTPHFEGTTERNLSQYQPVNNEFQRYPGHPANVSLSAVFPGVTATNLIGLAPRLQNGGSNFGNATSTTALPVKQDRLFSTIDELLYAPTRSLNAAGLTRDQVERAEFVLTVNSRAPETTLFDTPRISIWPVHSDLAANPASPYTTAFDRLSAFCSTLGNGYRFHFQRTDCNSASESSAIARNGNLISYLQNLTGRDVPGFGGNFLTKYGDDRDQILAEIFDYIRMANPFDDNLGGAGTAATSYSTTGTRYGFTPGRGNAGWYRAGHGQIVPTKLSGSARGFGRFDTVSEAALHLICVADGGNATSAAAATNPQMATYLASNPPLTATQKVLQIAFYLQMTNVAQNYDGTLPDYTFEVSGLPGMTVTGATPANPFPAGANAAYNNSNTNQSWHSRWFGTVSSHRSLLSVRLPPSWASNNSTAATSGLAYSAYPFVSMPFVVTVPAGTTTLDLSACTVTVKIYQGGTTAAANLVQTLTLAFPAATIPIPLLTTTAVAAGGTSPNDWPTLNPEEWWGFRTRFGFSTREPGYGYDVERGGCVIRRQFDVVRSLVPRWGDVRLISALDSVPSTFFAPHPLYNSSQRIVNTLTEGAGSAYVPDQDAATPVYNANSDLRRLVSGARYDVKRRPVIAPDPAATEFSERYMDWDNGLAWSIDGAWINKPDEGNVLGLGSGKIPYFDASEQFAPSGATFFTPNRIMPSPGMFGSLPSRVRGSLAAANAGNAELLAGNANSMRPWETLLFRPQTGHPGAASPPDHLWMDLFWMPTVEPYAISEPFSTAGKINMNYQIVPFTNIRRTTALRAAMKNEMLTAVPTGDAATYKALTTAPSYRFALNLDETTGSLRQFEEKFASPGRDLFRSASEICNVYLVPAGQSWSSISDAETYWGTRKLTGDNARERPYTNLYGKLTTKSNTYTVHYRVQLIKQPPNATAGQWDETKGKVQAEYRGSRQIERYIEPRDSALPDFAATPAAKLSDIYRLRLLNDRRFSP